MATTHLYYTSSESDSDDSDDSDDNFSTSYQSDTPAISDGDGAKKPGKSEIATAPSVIPEPLNLPSAPSSGTAMSSPDSRFVASDVH